MQNEDEGRDIKPESFDWYATVIDPEFKQRQKAEALENKDNVIVGIEDTVHWKGGEFQVVKCDQFADGDGLYFRDAGCWYKVLQLSKWDKYGPTKYVCNLGSKWQSEEALEVSDEI